MFYLWCSSLFSDQGTKTPFRTLITYWFFILRPSLTKLADYFTHCADGTNEFAHVRLLSAPIPAIEGKHSCAHPPAHVIGNLHNHIILPILVDVTDLIIRCWFEDE